MKVKNYNPLYIPQHGVYNVLDYAQTNKPYI